jgi:hypothetical protein
MCVCSVTFLGTFAAGFIAPRSASLLGRDTALIFPANEAAFKTKSAHSPINESFPQPPRDGRAKEYNDKTSCAEVAAEYRQDPLS